jgi:hypothetical protein
VLTVAGAADAPEAAPAVEFLHQPREIDREVERQRRPAGERFEPIFSPGVRLALGAVDRCVDRAARRRRSSERSR